MTQAKARAKHGKSIYKAGRPTGFTYRYKQDDYGVERTLQLLNAKRQVVAQADPFWPAGIPANLMIRQKQINDCAVRLYADLPLA